MKKKFFPVVFIWIITFPALSQKRYTPEEVTDQKYGINIYDRLNARIGGDSTRNCKGYACEGWVADFYTAGAILHKGYYVEGQLKIYQNFYQNGQMEREFKILDDYKCAMTVYHKDGKIKSEIKYVDGSPVKWEDFYSSGKPEYFEEFAKKGYYLAQKSFFENGLPQETLELVNKKKLIYSKKEFFENGKIKMEGETVYNEDLLDYQRSGKWSYFDEKGNVTKEEFYINGKINDEKNY